MQLWPPKALDPLDQRAPVTRPSFSFSSSTPLLKSRSPPASHGRLGYKLPQTQLYLYSSVTLQFIGSEEIHENWDYCHRSNRRHIVFSDVVMPGINGVELARKIRKQWPGLPVVLISGYSNLLAEESSQGFTVIKKPYSIKSLIEALRHHSFEFSKDGICLITQRNSESESCFRML
jgi:DNA-binding LytR/AlgR family response regulator